MMIATKVEAFMAENGFAEPVATFSGNGVQLIYKADRLPCSN